ncbi:MAG: cfp6 [Frankiales bacterium]|nr:cfp6 [Frankiales bacterium]
MPTDADRPVRFGPDKIALAPVLIVAIGTIPLAASDSRLGWLMLLPVLCAVWVLRARVVVRPDGLEVCNGLGVRRLPWEQVEGYDVPRRGPVRVLSPGGRTALTALPRVELRRLVEASEAASR